MPRAFTATESAAIRARLMAAGAGSFARRGLQRTTVDDLARAAGISKGAFYGFFDSKEALFLALVEEYETRKHTEIELAVRSDPAAGVSRLIQGALCATEDNPLLPVAMSDEGLRLLQRMSPEQREAFVQRDVLLARRVIASLAEAGIHIDVPPTVLTALLRALVFLGWHRADIGADLTDEFTGWFVPVLRDALLARAGAGQHGGDGWPPGTDGPAPEPARAGDG